MQMSPTEYDIDIAREAIESLLLFFSGDPDSHYDDTACHWHHRAELSRAWSAISPGRTPPVGLLTYV